MLRAIIKALRRVVRAGAEANSGTQMTKEPLEVLTIGHSVLSYERYVSLLKDAGVTAVADVRSSPRSRKFPHFDKLELSDALRTDGISYVFLGKELGGRPSSKQLYSDGVADYEKMAKTEDFKTGLRRVLEGAKTYRIALMCSEHHPLQCHRCLLVGRELARQGVKVTHILSDARRVDQSELETELVEKYSYDADFLPQEEKLIAAYRRRAREVAYSALGHKTKQRGEKEESSDSTCCNDRLYEEDSPRLL